ncbi:SDR family NAD(P)-dependent oxidoreductase [Nonomuraea endophytica]|uniref:NAD(P)-dependent dehydrogenase (Short-subunit alcohol dehydrogenase family) n=1 Tax=Nonomuraea endophytica TaxID=714136 RepID=A0A7W8ADW6_9ACTN|nr:SDR family oxidoreductase [Nonomuraea endophytica]MBB5083899.1 NAD(P)-dependent dehydrogenase (short-subunit alcohol dehydrogenase family) [Nonomuraea endophytica]
MALSPDGILLTGRVAVVTGGAEGVGRVVAEAFEAFGASVAVCDRVKIAGGQGLTMTLDVRDPMAADVFARAVEERYGRVDILVNSAGGACDTRFAETTAMGERTVIEENFAQLTAMIRRLLPLMRAGSSIINIGAAPGFAIQAAMTAAVAGLTASLAVELAPIRVNAIAPGRPPGDFSGAAAVAVFLAGEMARLVTGTTIHVGQE